MSAVCMLLQNEYRGDPRVRRKAEALVAAGYAVDVLALRPPDTTKPYTLNGVNVYTVSLGKKRGSRFRYLFEYGAFFAWAFVRLPRLMRRRRYAVVDVNTLPDFLVFAALLARVMGARLVLDMHEITPEFYMSKYGIGETSALVRLLKVVEKVSMDFADHVLTVNEPIQRVLAGRGLDRSRSTVIMNAVDEAGFASPPPAPAAPGPFVMMYHGTLTRIYGLDLALEAFALAHARMPEAELWILGHGPERVALEAQARRLGLSSKVRLLGAVPPADIPAWLGRCHAGVLPMRRDVFLDLAFPNKLSEYVITGKPVIIPRLNAIRHYFSAAALAYCAPNDPDAMAEQMVRLYGDPALRSRLAAAATAEYAPIRWDVMRQRYLDVIATMAARARHTTEPAAVTTVFAP